MADDARAGQDARMKQTSFAGAEFAGKKRQTRRERFLAEMETVVPWARLEAVIEPHNPKSGKVGRPPIGLTKMLRMYFLQRWYTLADEALEDALYNSQAMREFVGIYLARHNVPDATTLLKFRRLLEEYELGAAIRAEVNAHLTERGLLMRQGTRASMSTRAPGPQRGLHGRQRVGHCARAA
jgi:IS5 family transposase